MEEGRGNRIGPLDPLPSPDLSEKGRVNPPYRLGSSHRGSAGGHVRKKDVKLKGGEENMGDARAVRLLVFAQIVIIICFLIFVRYSERISINPSGRKVDTEGKAVQDSELGHYPLFQDVHVMIFVGFGFLMTFLRRFGYSALGYNMALAAIAIQWSVLCRGIFKHEGRIIPISLSTFINGDFAAAAVLITFGAVLGVASLSQLLFVVLVEVFLYAVNEYIGTELLQAVDIGGSIFIHTFGAYFGLAMSWVLRREPECESEKEGSSYSSDLFAMIGTLFLWMFWPSFNGAVAEQDFQERAIVNTILSLTASCLSVFVISALVSSKQKFNMVHIQNATLAGGVAVGAVADLPLQPFGALLVGGSAGVLSTLGFAFLTPLLQSKVGLHDTCGVHNLHGMPGVASGLLSAIMAASAKPEEYGAALFLKYPARAPPDVRHLQEQSMDIPPGLDRTAVEQGVYQLAALGVTLLLGIVGGAFTGVILRMPLFKGLAMDALFDDTAAWEGVEAEKLSRSLPDEVDLTARGGPRDSKDKSLGT